MSLQEIEDTSHPDKTPGYDDEVPAALNTEFIPCAQNGDKDKYTPETQGNKNFTNEV